MAPVGAFGIFTLFSDLPVEIGEIVRMYVS